MMQLFCQCNYSEVTTIINGDRQLFINSMSNFRRGTMRDFLFNVLNSFGDFDFTLPQIATLLLLDEEGELTVKQVAELLRRSVSATSRLLEQLVEQGLVDRYEDEKDRRAKRLRITAAGRGLIDQIEHKRSERQWAVIEQLLPQEQAEVAHAMALLARASKMKQSHEHIDS